MADAGITLFVERLPAWVAAVPGLRLPVLESLVARGRDLAPLPRGPDRARMALFGAGPATVPAGALTLAADAGRVPEHNWLRADPVTLQASMMQVYLAGAGMADFDAAEREAISTAVRDELAAQGLHVEAHHPERWVVRLERDLDFAFTPLDEALGGDVAENLPTAPAARDWKRLMNDLQIVLHNHPVNEARRAAGRATVNGVWFWGDGRVPSRPAQAPFGQVRSDEPVSAGLARCFGIALASAPGDPGASDGPLLVDWPVSGDPAQALRALDGWVGTALSGSGGLRLYAGDGRGWIAVARWRGFWRRRRPLIETFAPRAEPGPERT